MYYVGKNGQQIGPFTLDQLQAKYGSGEILPTDLVWKEGTADWKPANTFAELAAPGSAQAPAYQAAPAAVSPPYVPQSSTPAAYGPGAMLPGGAQIPNYLVWAILSTVCCCIPLGIPAIVFSNQVNGKLAVGDVAGAMEASRKAKMWCWIAFGSGLAVALIYFGIYGAAIAAAIAEESSRS